MLQWLDDPLVPGAVEDSSFEFVIPTALDGVQVRPAIYLANDAAPGSRVLMIDNLRFERLPSVTPPTEPFNHDFEYPYLPDGLYTFGVPGWTEVSSVQFLGLAVHGPSVLPTGASVGRNVLEFGGLAASGAAVIMSPPLIYAEELNLYEVSVDLFRRADVPAFAWVDLELINPWDGSVAAALRVDTVSTSSDWTSHSVCWSVPNGMDGPLKLRIRASSPGSGLARLLVDNIVVSNTTTCLDP